MHTTAARVLAGVGNGVLTDAVVEVWPRLKLEGGFSAETMRGKREILRCADFLDSFIESCGGSGIWGNAKVWLEDVVAQDGIPVVVLLYREDKLAAAALGSELMLGGCRMRLGVCGNVTGERGFFAVPGETEQEKEKLVQACADAMMQTGLLGMVFKRKSVARVSGEVQRGEHRAWSRTVGFAERIVHDTFQLGQTFDESVSKLGAHTRRNLRYYRRRSERELQCSFLPMLEGQELRKALVELQCFTDDPVRPGIAKNRIAQVSRDPQAFCMAVRGGDGRWLSWLSGWRVGGRTTIDWQCNRSEMQRYSLSTVMRSYLVEHESLLGQSELHFLGGTPHPMYLGFREESCTDLLMVRHAALAQVLRLGAPLMRGVVGLLQAILPQGASGSGKRRGGARRDAVIQKVRRVAEILNRTQMG